MKVIIIGPYPPPYGGISVHIKRMKRYLEEKHIDTLVYNELKTYEDICNNIRNIKSYKKFIFKIPFLKADIIHFHSIDIRVRILLGFYKLLGKKIILTIHGESSYEQLSNSNNFVQRLLINSFKRIDKIICVNSKTISDLSSYGVDKSKLICIPAYSNPIEDKSDFNRIPKEVWGFINNSNFLISANGCIRFNNNEDLYGIDMLIELIKKLRHKGYNVSLLISILGTNMQSNEENLYYQDLKSKIKYYNLSNDIMIFEVNDTEFYPILKKSKLFLRPTNTDGDAISIREALYYKIPSIVSDVVKRPEGTVLFKTRDIDDLYIKTVDVIENYDCYKEKISNIKIEDNAEKLLNIYKEL